MNHEHDLSSRKASMSMLDSNDFYSMRTLNRGSVASPYEIRVNTELSMEYRTIVGTYLSTIKIKTYDPYLRYIEIFEKFLTRYYVIVNWNINIYLYNYNI